MRIEFLSCENSTAQVGERYAPVRASKRQSLAGRLVAAVGSARSSKEPAKQPAVDAVPSDVCYGLGLAKLANFANNNNNKILQIFGGLVLGCIKTKFCKKICV